VNAAVASFSQHLKYSYSLQNVTNCLKRSVTVSVHAFASDLSNACERRSFKAVGYILQRIATFMTEVIYARYSSFWAVTNVARIDIHFCLVNPTFVNSDGLTFLVHDSLYNTSPRIFCFFIPEFGFR
jgi:hypothetical protein